MTAAEIKQRKVELKRQSIQARGIGQEDRIERAILLRIRRRYESRMEKVLDLELSQKIDCLTFLIES